MTDHEYPNPPHTPQAARSGPTMNPAAPASGTTPPPVSAGGAATTTPLPPFAPPPRPRGKVIGIVMTLVTIVVVSLISFGVRTALHAVLDPEPSASELASEAAKEMNESGRLPLRVDNVTLWDSVHAEGDELHYEYTVDAPADGEPYSTERIRAAVLPNVCDNKDADYLLEHGVRAVYEYSVLGDPSPHTFTISKNDC